MSVVQFYELLAKIDKEAGKKYKRGGREEMSRDKRRYPLSEEQFNQEVLPIILNSYRGKGHSGLGNYKGG